MKDCPNCKSEMPLEHEICWNCSYELSSDEIIEFKEAKSLKDKIEEEELRVEKTKKRYCLRCDILLEFKTNYNLNNARGAFDEMMDFLSGRHEPIDVYFCPKCKKVEFFLSDKN